jgi:L-2-hydroxyglutarate oxidase
VHLTRTVDGGVTVGPNAVLGFAREGYRKGSFRRRDVTEYLAFPGMWRVARANVRTGARELRNSLFKRGYLAECRRYCPSLTPADLLPEPAGIRAQAVLRDGTLVHDFLFAETPRTLHVCNAPSPAATSAMPIGAMIAARVT